MEEPEVGHVAEPELERQGRRLAAPAPGFLATAVALALPGLLMVIFGRSWVFAIGIALVALSVPVALVGGALLGSSVVARWAARHRPFA